MPIDKSSFLKTWLPYRDLPSSGLQDALEAARRAKEGPDRNWDPEAFRDSLRREVANQIATGEPPVVWRAVEQMIDHGIEPEAVVAHLELALLGQVQAAVQSSGIFDTAMYEAVVASLPLPDSTSVIDQMLMTVNEHPGITLDELREEVIGVLNMPGYHPPFQTLLDDSLDEIIDKDGPLCLLAGDRLVDRRQLTEGIVLTHRVTQAEITAATLDATVDLAVLEPDEEFAVMFTAGAGEPVSPAVDVHVDEIRHPRQPELRAEIWHGPEGWLAGCADGADGLDGATVAVRRSGETVRVGVLADEPATDRQLISYLRSAYDAAVREPGLPASVQDVVLGVLLDHADAFAVARPPLYDLLTAAGLEIRGSELAHDPALWDAARRLQLWSRVADHLHRDLEATRQVVSVVECFVDSTHSSATLRRCLDVLVDPDLIEVAVDELSRAASFDEGGIDRLDAFARLLVQRASAPPHVAAARWLEAAVAEEREDPLAAHAALEIAVEADPTWVPGIERLAWYRSDRGDGPGAIQLYSRLEDLGATSTDRLVIERAMGHARRLPEKLPGRNTPCWCGSGRKFKHCHIGLAAMPPLEERADWLYRKAVNYVLYGEREARSDLVSVVLARAGLSTADEIDDEVLHGDTVGQVAHDPLVADLVLSELGWFDAFLSDRAALLPPDELLMGQAWELSQRTLYEIVEVRPGEGLTVRDLRTAETFDVLERTFSRQGHPGMVFCGRAVPVGSNSQFMGGLFAVAPGTEAAVLDLLDEQDALEIAAYVAGLERPPVFNNREGEPLTLRRVVIQVADRSAALAALAEHYEPADDPEPAGGPGEPDRGSDVPRSRWLELFDIGDGEHVVRAHLLLAGDELTVEANSAARMDHVLEVLTGALGPLEIVSQTSTPLRNQKDLAGARAGGDAPPEPAELTPDQRAALDELRSRYEERWCDEEIPALAGFTPREAAADPTRRETLERLLLSFESYGDDESAMTMRPARLRSLLGLSAADDTRAR